MLGEYMRFTKINSYAIKILCQKNNDIPDNILFTIVPYLPPSFTAQINHLHRNVYDLVVYVRQINNKNVSSKWLLIFLKELGRGECCIWFKCYQQVTIIRYLYNFIV